MNDLIPKIAHVCWKTKDILDSESPLILNGLRNLIDMNPDWTVVLYDDHDVDQYLKKHLDHKSYQLLEHAHIVEKTDVWRLIKIFNEGGLYIDVDRFYNIKMSDVLDEGIRCVIPLCSDYDVSQDIMISSPGNPIYEITLELTMQRRRDGHTNTYLLGPQSYMHGVTLALLNEMIDTNPGPEQMKRIAEKINSTSFIKTYRENAPYDTVVYQHDPQTFKQGRSSAQTWKEMKKEFYAEHGVKHWMGA